MKKTLLIIVMGAMLSLNVTAQSTFTLNTRAWSTNYFTTLLSNIANGAVEYFIISDSTDRLTYSRVIPDADLVFPIGIEKAGFEASDIYGPYHRAFKNPFTKPGDFGVGLDASWRPSFIGFYAGAYFKSQEICFRANDDNLRSFYFQPRAGIILGKKTPSRLVYTMIWWSEQVADTLMSRKLCSATASDWTSPYHTVVRINIKA